MWCVCSAVCVFSVVCSAVCVIVYSDMYVIVCSAIVCSAVSMCYCV